MDDIKITIKQDDGNVLTVSTNMIEEDVIRRRCGLKDNVEYVVGWFLKKNGNDGVERKEIIRVEQSER